MVRHVLLLLGVAQAVEVGNAEGGESLAGDRLLGGDIRAPWFFDCSNHPEWRKFRGRVTEFRSRFATEDRGSPAMLELVQRLLSEANDLGRRYESIFVKWASSWEVFRLCGGEVHSQLRTDFCFYGFAVVQWLGLFGAQHFGSVPGMAEWSHNARGFLTDAAKFNSMHFLESSGWPVKLVEMAQALSQAAAGHSNYRPARDAALPSSGATGPARRTPAHLRSPSVQRIRATAVSYHAALLREPLTVWLRMLRHRFDVETAVHVLDATARTSEDNERLHAHCRFAEGAWCASDERLLRLNELLEGELLSCHNGDHKARHHFITDTEAYYALFVELLGRDEAFTDADLLLCGEPVFFCRLLSHFGRPLIGYISTPLSVYVRAADRPQWYQAFYDLALDPRNVFAVTTPVFGEWIAYATGISLPVVRPVCLYTDATYWPSRAREVLLLRTISLFWDSECVLNYFAREAAAVTQYSGGNTTAPLRFVESVTLSAQERVGYGTFAEFLAAVIYPYAFSQFWFYELYAMAVPLYLPARESLALFVSQDYAVCPDFEGHRPGHRPHAVHPYSPFDTEDWAAVSYWAAYTDYMLLPHVEYFSSVPELLLKLESGDHRARSAQMQQTHAEHLGAATTFWLNALENVASFRGEAAQPASEDMEPSLEPLLRDELRDLSTRQPCGGSPARPDGPPRMANDGGVRQDHPYEFHAQDGAGGSHWWVQLRRVTIDPEVKLWPRDCCREAFGHRLWILIGNSSEPGEAAECASVDVVDSAQLETVCLGVGGFLFVEARPQGGWGYENTGEAVLMLPEVRVLSRD